MKKINIAELLKDCPKGMKLYSPIFGEVYLDKIRPHLAIVVTTDKEQGDLKEEFLYDGRYGVNGECMLFPSKYKATWEGFQRPFKDGDIVFYDNCVSIFKEYGEGSLFRNYVKVDIDGKHPMLYDRTSSFGKGVKREARFATEEEKAKLFQTIKGSGYRWNAETKTLEKLPKFKVGDKVQLKKDIREKRIIDNVLNNCYTVQGYGVILFTTQDEWELVPNKFDITTLKPFESKVLVCDYNDKMWVPAFWGKLLDEDFNCRYLTSCGCYKYCIPYEGNEHLLGTANDCDEYFKTWK